MKAYARKANVSLRPEATIASRTFRIAINITDRSLGPSIEIKDGFAEALISFLASIPPELGPEVPSSERDANAPSRVSLFPFRGCHR